MPGIDELVERAKARISAGLIAYDALEKIARRTGRTIPAAQARAFEDNGRDLGYALLLKRYVDDPRKATPEQIDKAAWDTVPSVAPLFWSFRIMVGLGFYFIALFVARSIWLAPARLLNARWLLKVAFCVDAAAVDRRRARLDRRRVRPPALDDRGRAADVPSASPSLGVVAGVCITLVGFVVVLLGAAGRRGVADASSTSALGPARRRLTRTRRRALSAMAAEEQRHDPHESHRLRNPALIWWVLLGVLLIGFAVTDGFDLGVGHAAAVRRQDRRRSGASRSTPSGPVWEGNQVWFILGGGAIFAAWPPLYAVSFSGFYLAMFVLLAALILRPVGFKYRSKRPDPRWRNAWDWALFAAGFVPALIFGVAVGNALQGVPFRFTDEMRIVYEGSFLGLLNPFAVLCGLLSIAMMVMHGGAWLGLKASGNVAARGRWYGSLAAVAVIVLFAVDGLVLSRMAGYRITSEVFPARRAIL